MDYKEKRKKFHYVLYLCCSFGLLSIQFPFSVYSIPLFPMGGTVDHCALLPWLQSVHMIQDRQKKLSFPGNWKWHLDKSQVRQILPWGGALKVPRVFQFLLPGASGLSWFLLLPGLVSQTFLGFYKLHALLIDNFID